MKTALERAAAFVETRLTLKVFLPLLALALATTWYGLFYSKAEFEALTGGSTFMDMQPGLTRQALFAQIGAYSEGAARYYLRWSVFDFAWPLITFTTMVFISRWLLAFLPAQRQHWFWLFIASAYTTVAFDWAENAGFMTLVLVAPAEPGWLAGLTLALHGGKLLFNMVFNLAFWGLLVLVIAKRLQRTRETPA